MNTTTTNSTAASPPTVVPSSADSDLSPLISVLALVVLVVTPTLIYAFFFAIKCPRNAFRRLHRSFGGPVGEFDAGVGCTEVVSGVEYEKESNGGECPVCLSSFVEGEEIRQLRGCRHAFHAACINTWLRSRSSCPVCRAVVTGKRLKPSPSDGENDLREGLPDSASLV